MIDIVIPNGNEKEFVEMASKLGYDSLCFLYSKPTKIEIKSKLKLYSGVLTTVNNIGKYDSDLVCIKGSDDNRIFFESSKGDLVFGLEIQRKDFIHHRSSGLNHVLCSLAKEKEKVVCVSFSDLINSSSLERSRMFGRISQNIVFARKYKFSLGLASFATNPLQMRSPHDFKAFLIVLGMHPSESKNALSCVEKKILNNFRKKSSSYIAEGIEIIE
jgi:RNase P/RNase MRP subunit p30